MSTERATERGAEQVPPWRALRRQLVALATTLAAVVLLGLALSMGATAVQAGRDEARNVDVVIVVAPAVPSEALVEHSFELYRRGYGPQIVAVGSGSEGLSAALRERGVAESTLSGVASTGGETEQLKENLANARAAGAATVLIAGEGADMLRWLKIASDAGLQPYGAPTSEQRPDPLELVGAAGRYWAYVLLQR